MHATLPAEAESTTRAAIAWTTSTQRETANVVEYAWLNSDFDLVNAHGETVKWPVLEPGTFVNLHVAGCDAQDKQVAVYSTKDDETFNSVYAASLFATDTFRPSSLLVCLDYSRESNANFGNKKCSLDSLLEGKLKPKTLLLFPNWSPEAARPLMHAKKRKANTRPNPRSPQPSAPPLDANSFRGFGPDLRKFLEKVRMLVSSSLGGGLKKMTFLKHNKLSLLESEFPNLDFVQLYFGFFGGLGGVTTKKVRGGLHIKISSWSAASSSLQAAETYQEVLSGKSFMRRWLAKVNTDSNRPSPLCEVGFDNGPLEIFILKNETVQYTDPNFGTGARLASFKGNQTSPVTLPVASKLR